jgi:hypothetical protein
MGLERLIGVAPSIREERLYNGCRHVLNAIESGVRRDAGVALAMAEVMVEADLIGVVSFPVGEKLRHHEDLVTCYGLAREAMAAHVPPAEVLVRLPSLGFFLYVLLCLWRIDTFCIGSLMVK